MYKGQARDPGRSGGPGTEPVATAAEADASAEGIEGVRKGQPRIGRNDPCFCGSGKKYKKCHGASESATD